MSDQIKQKAGDYSTQIGVAYGPVHIYQSGRPPTYFAPFPAQSLPPHFVPRPEVTDDLKARLMNEQPAAPGILVISALHGLGGIGKSTLAAALVYDEAVQKRFPDGILWAILGQQPEILSIISGWIHAMGDCNFRPTTVETASNHLRTLLHDKAVLLVVDDVWQSDHAVHFKASGPCCHVLMTTRDALVAKAVGAELYRLDVMTAAQALTLLSARLGRALHGEDLAQAQALARDVGYLPLALELLAAQVAEGIPWTELRAEFQAEIVRLEVLETPGVDEISAEGLTKRLSLRASFALSLRRLSPEHLARFAWLGILPEDVSISAAMAATLWDTDVCGARDALRYLCDKALLSPGPALPEQPPIYRLHDLLHDSARALVPAPPTPPSPAELPGLGLALPAAHAAFLARYHEKTRKHNRLIFKGFKDRKIAFQSQLSLFQKTLSSYQGIFRKCFRVFSHKQLQDGLWHTLSDDGYIHAHLTWHLHKAGQVAQLHALLREETAAGRHGWHQARERLGQTAGFLEDVRLARTIAEQERQIGLQCRYALILASFNSLAKNIPRPLLCALVRHGLWSPAQGLAYARQVPGAEARTDAFLELLPELPQLLRDMALRDALNAVQVIQSGYYQAEALAALAHHLPTALLNEALSTAQKIEREMFRASALTALVPHLLEEQRAAVLREALRAAQAIQSEYFRAKALVALAPHLLEEQRTAVLQAALSVSQAIQDEKYRAEALTALAPHLPEEQRTTVLREALSVSQAIQDEKDRAEALTALAPHLPEALLREALSAAQTIESEWQRAEVLAALAPHLPEALLEEALLAAQAIESEWQRAEVLAVLVVPHLPKAMLPEPLSAAQVIESEGGRPKALSELAPHLPETLLWAARIAALKIRIAALKINYEYRRTDTLAALEPHLPEAQRTAVLREALSAAQAIESEYDRAKVVTALAPHLPAALLLEALRAAQAIRDKDDRAKVLAALAPRLPEALLPEALSVAQAIQDEWRRVQALTALASRLPTALLPDALSVAQAIQDEWQRVQALTALASRLPTALLPDEQRAAALREALSVAQAIQDEKDRAKALAVLAPHLCKELLSEALTLAPAIDYADNRAQALKSVVPRLIEYPVEELLRLWPGVLARLAQRSRQDLLSDLEALTPVIAIIGGDEAIAELARAIQGVGRWWP
ncbi:NB-ARC domain protein [Candidatus Vecturithrix granuli]|uniref:NB-ARC domain protein n=1 Tax=Vecturithrix granuli TaxID=1499967 RepID=A0A081C2J4_VECG1|nr:NB-ARC domain protein [Candidatus Vecturithrix granuli]